MSAEKGGGIMRRKRCIAFAGVLLGLLGLGSVEALAAGPSKITKCQTITQSGSYAVENNLTATGDCLVIAADFVTLDLGGFVLTGGGTGQGVTDLGSAHKGIVVRNGMVTNFGVGISLVSEGAVVEGVRAINNSGSGIFLLSGTLTGSTATNNALFGILSSGIVAGNTAISNGSDGIVAGSGAVLTGNVTGHNGGRGIFVFGASSIVTGNTATSNVGDGIEVGAGITATGNSAAANGGHGLEVFCPSNVIGNTAVSNTGTNLMLNGIGCNDSNNVAP